MNLGQCVQLSIEILIAVDKSVCLKEQVCP